MRGLFRRRTFRHGIHPPDAKAETCGLQIRQFPFAPVMAIPLLQHIGQPAVPVVREGQAVRRGEVIARPGGFLSVAMHAPVSGTVREIALVPSLAGYMMPGIILETEPGSTQEVVPGTPCPLDSATPEAIVAAIRDAGIVGLGGAAFPTHAKLELSAEQHIDTLIINGIECEPCLTTDHRVMLEQTADVVTGVDYLLKACGARRAIIAVEANKRDAAAALEAARGARHHVSVALLPVKYPQGAAPLLVTALLGREVPIGGRTTDVGAQVINVATTAEIGRLLPAGRGIQERVVTVGGSAVRRKGNYRVAVGTPLRFILDTVGVTDDIGSVVMGGPLMGQAVPNLDVPVTKGTCAIIAFTATETARRANPEPCIHCGRCVEACPMGLNPAQLGLLAQREQFAPMAAEFHLGACFECGACAYVCPARIPLVQYFRLAKAALRKLEAAA